MNTDSFQHSKVKAWWEEMVSGSEAVGMAWIVILGFLRIVTSDVVMPRPLSSERALKLIDERLNLPTVTVVHPSRNHWELLRELLQPLGTAGNLTSDAHLAAITVAQGATLCSADTDFSRFSPLRWKNPLAAGQKSRA